MAVRTVTRRGKRRLVIDFTFRRPDGTKGRYRHDAEVQTRAGALAEERRRLGAVATTGSPFEIVKEAVREQVVPQPPVLTFGKLADRFLTEFCPARFKRSTCANYASVIQCRLKPALGTLPVSEITTKVVRDLDMQMVKAGLKQQTRRHTLIVIRSVLCNFAVEAEIIDRAPRMPELPDQGSVIPSTMSPEEVQRALSAAKSRVHRLPILLAAHAGLRYGEVRALRCGDVDLAADRLVVRTAMFRSIEQTPKSGSHRQVPLTPELREELIAAGVDKRDRDERAALAPRGRPWGASELGRSFRRTLKRANLPAWRFHDLRHFYVTTLCREGVPVHVVRVLAGHSGLNTTQRYAHVPEADRLAAVGALSRALGNKKTGA